MKSCYSKSFRLGIVGGGQLGRMFIQEAINYDVRIAILDPAADAPCAPYAHEFTQGNFNDFNTVLEFGRDKDVLTIEIEHVNVDALAELKKQGIKVYPDPDVLRIVKDKGLQKKFYAENNIPTAPFVLVNNKAEIEAHRSSFPFMQKMRTGGYDGKGVTPLRHDDDLLQAFDAPSVLEQMIPFEKELAVIAARNANGEISLFPVVEMEFNPEANLVEFLFSPANISPAIEEKAKKIAHDVVEKLGHVGLLAVELFLTREGEILVNEIAPRPHNSGHHTIEACYTSQYEQHLRAILNFPLGDTTLLQPAVMINLLGEKEFSGPVKYEGMEQAMATPGVFIHLYGKSETKPFRKMGHVTVMHSDLNKAKFTAKQILSTLKVKS